MNFYLLSRNRRPSQLLGGDLCRTEFMVHLFGTIWACKSFLKHQHQLLCRSVCLSGVGRLSAKSPRDVQLASLLFSNCTLIFFLPMSAFFLPSQPVGSARVWRAQSCSSHHGERKRKSGPKKKEKHHTRKKLTQV